MLLGRLNGSECYGRQRRRYSRRHSICPAASLTFDATDSCSWALDDISSYRCAPAYWRAVAGCSHPAVAASLLLVAAHLSGISESDTSEDAAVLEQGKTLGGDSCLLAVVLFQNLHSSRCRSCLAKLVMTSMLSMPIYYSIKGSLAGFHTCSERDTARRT